MSFPYTGTEGWVGFGCDGTDEWVYVGFSQQPNLTNDETKSGYNQIKTRVKWDDEVEATTLIQNWGDKFLHFYSEGTVIPRLTSANSVLLELSWYGEGNVYFRFSLAGSSAAINTARRECGMPAKAPRSVSSDGSAQKAKNPQSSTAGKTSQDSTYVVRADHLTLKDAPAYQASDLIHLPRGSRVTLIQKSTKYYWFVRTASGHTGYVFAEFLRSVN